MQNGTTCADNAKSAKRKITEKRKKITELRDLEN